MLLRFLELLITGVVIVTVVRGVIRIIAAALSGFVASQTSASQRPSGPSRPSTQPEALHKDPVCGTFVAASTAVQKTRGGQTYYFCSTECRDKF